MPPFFGGEVSEHRHFSKVLHSSPNDAFDGLKPLEVIERGEIDPLWQMVYRQIPSGTRYLDLQPVIGICVLNRSLFAQADGYHLSFRFRSNQRSDLVFTDQLQFHLLELPKFVPVGDHLSKLPRLERWLYFLQRAPYMEPEELAAQLVEPEYLEAIEILQMISRSPEDRDLYEARMKFLNDQEAKLIASRQQGVLIGKIQLVQQLLGEPVDTTDDVAALGQ